MSTSAPQPGRDDQAPRPADAAALGEAAAQAAAQADSAQDARAAVARAAEETAGERGFSLTDDDIRRFVNAFVGELERRGAWDSGPTAASAQPSEAAAQPVAEQAAAETVAPAVAQPDADAETPRPKSFAERFMGQ